MKKRFTDCDKWDDPWFRKLSPINKVIIDFLQNKCDQAGFWKIDKELCAVYVGAEFDATEFLKAVNYEKERIRVHDEHWQLLGFIEFQNKNLSKDCNAHKPIFDYLEFYKKKGYNIGYTYPTPTLPHTLDIPYGKGSLRVQDKDKETDKVKDKDKDKEAEKPNCEISVDNLLISNGDKILDAEQKKSILARARHLNEKLSDAEIYKIMAYAGEKIKTKRLKAGFMADYQNLVYDAVMDSKQLKIV